MKVKSIKAKKGSSSKASTKVKPYLAATSEPALKMKTEWQSAPIEEKTNGTATAGIKRKKLGQNDKSIVLIKKAKRSSAEAKVKVETETNGTVTAGDKTKIQDENDNDNGTVEAPKHIEKGCTIFIANLPPTTKKSELKALFIKFGPIKTIRFRTNDGKVMFFKKDRANVSSLNGYVRFACKEDMMKACEMNGQMVGEHRIRVCPENKKQIGDVRTTVFVGNIGRATTENDLYDFFEQVGAIEFIRLISHKCVAYVSFKKGVSIKRVLKLDQQKLNTRPLRIQRLDTQRTNVKLNKKGNLVKRQKFPFKPKESVSEDATKADGSNDGKASDAFHGNVSDVKNKKKTVRSKSGVGSAKHKKMLANKLKAAMKV